MDDPNITMEEYIRLEEEKARRQGRTFNWQTARYGKMEYYENKDYSFTDLKTKYLAIVLDDASDTTLSCEPTVSPLDNNKIDFKISFDESDDEDYMVIFDKNSFSCKIVSVDNLKTDSENENDKVNIPSSPSPKPMIGYFDDLDFFKDIENEFPAIVYNDIKSKSDPLNVPSISSHHIDKFETSLSEYDEKKQNVLCLNDLFSLNIFFSNNPKTIKDNDDNIDITQLSRSNILNIDAKRSNELPRTNHNKINKVFNENFFIKTLDADIVNMAPLPHRDPRHPWLRYQVDRYDEGIVRSYEQRLETIWGRPVNRVHVLDFARLTDGMRPTLGDRLSMVYAGDDGQVLFTSHAWRMLFEVRASLVRELMMEFFSIYRISDIEMGLDVADTLCF
ncbi:hypothetical protein Tco_0349204 [Tanacetum coccineum]